MLGTDSGMQLQYAAVAAGSVLVIGTERIFLLATVCGVAVALAIALELLVPHDTGLLTAREMLENFVVCVVGTSFILFLIVFYAVREMNRAEAIAEREFRRSETLLANILPLPIIGRLKARAEPPSSPMVMTMSRSCSRIWPVPRRGRARCRRPILCGS